MKFKNALRPFFFILIGNLFFYKAKAQDSLKVVQPNEVTSLNKVKLYLLGFGLEREQKIAKTTTIHIGYSIEGIVPFYPNNSGGSDVLSIDYGINLAPVLIIGFKNYYNLQNRNRLRKITANNSASFVGIEYNLIAPMLINDKYTTSYVNSFSPMWGFQKSTSKKLNIEFYVGPSIQTNFSKTRISGFAKFGLAFLI